ncbi:MAG: mevalonate kinase [archaeon]|nr:mevalonate kinase [archaeon]
MAKGIGFGKTILFGEHFVVYGLPGIAGAISNKTICEATPANGFEFVDKRPAVEGYKQTKKAEIASQLDAIKKRFTKNILQKGVKITLAGDLECASGIGASAALATSIARALNEYYDLNLGDDEVNKIAFEAEEAGSGKGNVSGIDNTCSTYGGMISFKKNLAAGQNKISTLRVKKPLRIVLASTGITQETKKVVADVKKEKEKNPERFEKIFSEYEHLYTKAIAALKEGDEEGIGKLMNHNQKLLEEITVSSPEIEEICQTARSSGALGAKLTGTGRGGLVVCLAKDQKNQEKIAKAITQKGLVAKIAELGSQK